MTSENPKASLCLMYDHDAEDAATFYAATFPNSAVGKVHRAPADYPDGQAGRRTSGRVHGAGHHLLGVNGGPRFAHSEAFSIQVSTADQAETDRYWNAIVGNGGKESQCGWCKDKWGLSWQITPAALTRAMSDADPAVRKRVFEAMMHMKKIDCAALEAARRG